MCYKSEVFLCVIGSHFVCYKAECVIRRSQFVCL